MTKAFFYLIRFTIAVVVGLLCNYFIELSIEKLTGTDYVIVSFLSFYIPMLIVGLLLNTRRSVKEPGKMNSFKPILYGIGGILLGILAVIGLGSFIEVIGSTHTGFVSALIIVPSLFAFYGILLAQK